MTWDNPVNKVVLGPELLKEMEQEVVKIRQKLKVAPDRQKSYADKAQGEQGVQCWGSCLPQSEGNEEFLESWKLCQDVTNILWVV